MTAFAPPADAITITFPQPARLINMNHRDNRYERARAVKAWRTTTRDYAKYANVVLVRCRDLPPSFVAITIDVPTRARRDPINLTPVLKAATDGLVDAGVFRDDTPEYVTTLEPRLRHSPDRLVTIHIWPRDGAA